MARGKPIHLSVKAENENIIMSVKDHGIGIAKTDLSRIFERFERAVSGNNFAGLGLGLYIVTQLLEAHQGRIRVESNLGEGSRFTFSIPRKLVSDFDPALLVTADRWQHETSGVKH